MLLSKSHPTLTNSIIWSNSPESIYLESYFEPSSPLITYSDIEDGWDGEGNIDADPLFTNPENGDYTLMENSPCIDAGIADIDGVDDITDFIGAALIWGHMSLESHLKSWQVILTLMIL